MVELTNAHGATAKQSFSMRLATMISGSTYDEFVWDYEKETDPARRARLATVYAEITGENIEQRLERLTD
jgi:hypothetical protein